MDAANDGLPIPDDVQTTIDGRENGRNPCQMMYETTVGGSDQRTYHTCQMMYEATVDGRVR